MKTKITLFCLLAFLCFTPKIAAQCTFGSQNPSQTYTPIYDGNEYIIHSNSHPGEYMLVNALSTATIYKFRSSLPTDYITITDANGAQVFANGLNGSNGINFTPPYPQVVRFYLHANASCESNPFSTRTRFLKTTTVTYPCDSPSNITVSNITSNSAKVSWVAPVIGTNFSYEVYANTSGVAPVSNTNPTVEAPVDTEAQLSGLTPNATIYYWVRTQCVADAGIWVPAGSFVTNASSACNGAPYGLYPETTFVLACNGTVEQIVADAYAGEYSNVSVSSNQQYTFSSSVATDFITITDPTGVTVYTSGQTPLVWINNSNWATVRYYLHSNASCGSAETARIKSIKCGGNVVGGCTSGDLHPSTTFTPACTGSVELVVNDAWAGEYSNINVTSNKQYTFSSAVSSDFITIVNPTGNVVLANGPAPLSWNSGSTSGVVRYYLHTNANCGTQDINRQRYIQCSNTVSTCSVPTSLSVSNITSNSSRLNWSSPASVPGLGYDIYIVTTNTAPVAATTATLTSTTAGVGVLNGLTAATTYYYWLRSNCGTTKSAWVSGGNFTTLPSLSCNGAQYGLYPETTFTPVCSGSVEQIVADTWAGEYSNVNIIANKQYTFTSSVATDFVTITNAAGTTVLASGVTPLIWSSGTTAGVIRYHLNTNASCGVQNVARVRSIKCADVVIETCLLPTALSSSNLTSNSCRLTWTAPTPTPQSYDLYVITTNTAPIATTTPTANSTTAGVGVLNGLNPATTYFYWIRSNCGTTKSAWVSGGSFTTTTALSCNGAIYGLYPNTTFTPTCTGTNQTVVTDAWAGEYSNINYSPNKVYTFTSSVATDYITITNASGTIVFASGSTPLNWTTGTTSGTVRYYIHSNANCGTVDIARVRSVKCADAQVVSCGYPTGLNVTNITSDSCRINWAIPDTLPSYYELYIITTNTAPIFSTNATATVVNSGLTVYSYLQPSTTYYYWLRSVCGSTKTDWATGGSFTTLGALACNGAVFGLHPEDTITLENTGAPEPVAFQALASSYSNVNVTSNKQYVFTSSITTDYITVTNAAGTAVLASGQSPLSWASSSYSGMIRYYLHANANCGPDDLPRDKYITSSVLGIDENIVDNQLKMYPNPSAGQFTVDTGNRVAKEIMIIDNLGRVVSIKKPESAKTVLTLDGLSDGIYYVKINSQNQNVTKKLVLKKN